MSTPDQSPLGKTVAYAGQYDPGLLFPIPRAAKRAELGLGEELPFLGVDIWNAYELSWLDARGVSQLRADEAGASLTFSVTTAFATRWLVPRLGRFARRCPGIDLQLKAGTQPVDFDQDDIDLAVRIGRGGVAGATAIPLFGESVVPLASPAFIRQHGLRRPADLARVPLLHDDSMRRVGRPTRWSEWLAAAKVRNVDTGHGMHIDDGHLVLQAAAGGSGVALGRLVYALDDLDARRLRMPFGPVLDLDVQYYLFVPEARANEPAIAAARAWLVQEAESFVPRLREFIRASIGPPHAGRLPR